MQAKWALLPCHRSTTLAFLKRYTCDCARLLQRIPAKCRFGPSRYSAIV